MPENQGVATTRRRLRTELRRLRESAKLHQADVVKKLDWSISKLIRIENGSVGISITDLKALTEIYGVDQDAIEELVKLARVTRERHWWSAYRNILSPAYREFIAYESDAVRLTEMHPTVIPGILQVEEYARDIGASTRLQPISADKVELLAQVRQRRREEVLLGSSPRKYSVLLDEAVLRRVVGGPATMRKQLDHLVKFADGLIDLAVLPFSAGAHPGMTGAFYIMDFASPEEPSVLYLETATGNPALREPAEVNLYRQAFMAMQARSLRGVEAIEFVTRAGADLA